MSKITASSITGLTGAPTFTNGAVVSGTTTSTSFRGTFIGDGSGLIGVAGTGTGIVIKDDGTLVGTAATIDFGSNLNVTPISAGIVTVSLSTTGIITASSFSGSNINVTGVATIGDYDGNFILDSYLFNS